MTRRGLMGALVSGVGLALGGCAGLFGKTVRLRYAITITIGTPDGIRSGSAVQEIVRFQPFASIQPINNGSTEMHGDAIAIAVGDTHYFVGLIGCSNLLSDAIGIGTVSPPSVRNAAGNAAQLQALKDANGRADLDGHYYMSRPSRHFGLLSFADERDFSTMSWLRFGPDLAGWTLERVEVAVTTAPITRQAVAILPWLPTLSRQTVKDSPQNDGHLLTDFKTLSDRFGENQ